MGKISLVRNNPKLKKISNNNQKLKKLGTTEGLIDALMEVIEQGVLEEDYKGMKEGTRISYATSIEEKTGLLIPSYEKFEKNSNKAILDYIGTKLKDYKMSYNLARFIVDDFLNYYAKHLSSYSLSYVATRNEFTRLYYKALGKSYNPSGSFELEAAYKIVRNLVSVKIERETKIKKKSLPHYKKSLFSTAHSYYTPQNIATLSFRFIFGLKDKTLLYKLEEGLTSFLTEAGNLSPKKIRTAQAVINSSTALTEKEKKRALELLNDYRKARKDSRGVPRPYFKRAFYHWMEERKEVLMRKISDELLYHLRNMVIECQLNMHLNLIIGGKSGYV